MHSLVVLADLDPEAVFASASLAGGMLGATAGLNEVFARRSGSG